VAEAAAAPRNEKMMDDVELACLGPASADRFAVRPLTRRPPGKGEIEVRVEATSVNPIDVRRSDGYGARLFRLMKAGRFPLVLGNDFAGSITAVGEDVQNLSTGDAVFGLKPASANGTHATHVIAKAAHVLKAAASREPCELAILPYSFVTMYLALRGAGLTRDNARGQDVLVHGASGGLGLLAVQLLAQWGANVTAIGWADSHSLLRSAGASNAVDAASKPFAGLDAHFTATLNFASWDDDLALIGCLRTGALGHATTVHPLLATIDRLGWVRGAVASMTIKRRHRMALPAGCRRYGWTLFRPDQEALTELGAVSSHIFLPVGCSVSLAQGPAAFAHVRDGKQGRAVIRPSD
jgi:reticulon-4-interacting protein 1, mitochondrial